MDSPSSRMRDLARQLLAEEAAAQAESDAQDMRRVSDKLRSMLTRFAGADGFAALQRRALALASAEVPSLRGINLSTDGRLEGLDNLASERHGAENEATVAITAQLLGLLVTFIGEPLTRQLVREAWPEASLDE